MAAAGKFKVEWHGEQVRAVIAGITRDEEKAAAHRIERRLHKYVPVGSTVRVTPMYGKSYQSRYPGRLKSSIRVRVSKFPDGGYIVLVGDYNAYYAYWVEYGTIFTWRQKFGRKGEKYMKRSIALEKSRFTRNLRKRLT